MKILPLLFLLPALASASPAEQASASNNAFAIDFFKRISATEKGNLFFSPYSISTAFAIVADGAAGVTGKQISRTFHFADSNETNVLNFSTLQEELNKGATPGGIELAVANGLWIAEQYPVRDEFLKTAKEKFSAAVENDDFTKNADGIRKKINAWVTAQTKDRIKDLFPERSVNESTRLILANAVYFKGTWQTPFEKRATQPDDFHPEGGAAVKIPMMHLTSSFGYAEGDSAQWLELPYKGDALSMVVILPKQGTTGATLAAGLGTGDLKKMLAELGSRRVEVALPRFTMEYAVTLNDILQAMGTRSVFTQTADLSGITARRDLYISTAVHKAFVQVNEEGTEAAAATGIMMETAAMPMHPPVVFRADHPFLFLIREKQSGAILFMGSVARPESKE